MLGAVDQLISLVSYGNDALYTGHTTIEFLDHPNYDFANKNIWVTGKRYFNNETQKYYVVNNANMWFERLIAESCTKLRLLFSPSTLDKPSFTQAGYDEGGKWFVKAVYEGYSDYWILSGLSHYQYVSTETYNKAVSDTISEDQLTNLKTQLAETLNDIAEFAKEISNNRWAPWRPFVEAQRILKNPEPYNSYYYKDILVNKNYSLLALQVFFCAANAWCFNGMGSWADIGGFSDSDYNNRYYKLTEQLYLTVCRAIAASINSF